MVLVHLFLIFLFDVKYANVFVCAVDFGIHPCCNCINSSRVKEGQNWFSAEAKSCSLNIPFIEMCPFKYSGALDLQVA